MRPGLLVGGGAAAIEQLVTGVRSGSLSSRLLEGTCRALEYIHIWTGKALVFCDRCGASVLARAAWPYRLAFLAAVMAALTAVFAAHGRHWLLAKAEITEKQIRILAQDGALVSFGTLVGLATAVSLLLVVAPAVAFLRRRCALLYLQAVTIAYFLVWLAVLYFVAAVPGSLYLADGKNFTKYHRNDLWVSGFWTWLAIAAPGILLLLCLAMSAVKAWYRRTAVSQELVGDRIVRSIRTNGKEPVCRTSFYWSAFVHVLFIFIIPVLLRGCDASQEAYGVPLGQGIENPQLIQVVHLKKPKKSKPKKRYFLNPNSPISFYQPDIDQSIIREQVESDTLDTYVATSLKQKTGLGKGGPGKGGWPHGMANARVRFLRLKYDGGDWDQDMGVGADYNLLVMFNKYTGFKIADNTEAIPIGALRHFPKHRAPPFVFITGAGSINVSTEEVKTLRWYCLEETGMLFADNGGGNFNSSFRSLVKRVFPELDWVDIANDDVVYQQPFLFPNGAPPLWHHSGNRAAGMKYNERWIVFYHQGDLNDAWKTGHSGATEAQAVQAYKLGVNIMNYTFNQYMAAHFGQ